MVANRTMSKSRRLIFATAATTAAALAILTSCSSVSAQKVTPTPVQDMGWTRVGSELFIQGGAVTLNGVTQLLSPQTFALDLSTSWSVSEAPWRALSNGAASQSLYAISSINNQTVQIFKYVEPSSYTITEYDVVRDIWNTPEVLTDNPDVFAPGLTPVMNTLSNLVYIVGKTSMNELRPKGPNWWRTQELLPNNTLTSRYFGSALFNQEKMSIMYVGGYNYGVSPTQFDPQVLVTVYMPVNGPRWSFQKTTGSPPAPIVTLAYTGAINILNMNTATDTGTWTAGPPHTTPRVYAACVLIGDQFVVWGGSDGINTIASVEPIVYDLILNKWVNNYRAPSYYSSNPTTNPTPTSGSGSKGNQGPDSSPGSDSSSSSAGAGTIIGGVVGGLVVVGVVIGFLLYIRQQNSRLKELQEQVSQASHRLEDGGNITSNNDISGGGKNTGAPVVYPKPPTFPSNNNNNNNNAIPTHDNYGKLELSPDLRNHPQQYLPAATTTMSSPQTFNDNNNYNSPQTPQPTQASDPQGGVQMYQPDAADGGADFRGPQVYLSPVSAPQAIDNDTNMPGYYHEQESGTRHQNHPQEY
ncbi:hypothetical protein KI688_006504 [Linnemannia hyalina]|uniref:Galactose oxidase n=1 Tax=Linnemannia hyalina TaxID=64524 RepID=A0A9P8BQR1_9FUNG|nr:hypothetical protein KI688_006504 [Linnemannia hyalina]